ncbi:MAG: RNA-directed DNA polymerase [Moraxellaceae bacterium]|nr:RNA-directed DNA polymerase [Moraxellaceae bacterium]
MTVDDVPKPPVSGAPISQMTMEWLFSTKEGLHPSDVLEGLLDHGLFAEKIPPCFTSEGLADFTCKTIGSLLNEPTDKKLKSALNGRTHDYMRYEALRDSNIPRHMGVPHPEAYAIQSLTIAKHWLAIAKHCNQPSPSFSRIHVRHIGNGCIFEMNYKGSERFRFEEDELKWMSGAAFVVEADIATCFPSIYTHSIPWALHGKEASKKNSSLIDLEGNLLDKCTQNTRDRQTNGLLIGPHASNIISEIILTKIDVDLQAKGHIRVKRYIDDYHFYAKTFDEAERFIKDLGLALRAYEMSLNEKKTKIHSLPRPSNEDWILVLNRHTLPQDRDLKYSEIRSYLDLALSCAQSIGKSTPLNYAIKVLAKTHFKSSTDDVGETAPRQLGLRARQMYAQEAMNLALAYPYLVPLLDEFVFTPYCHDGLKDNISKFATDLVLLGLRKLYPDALAHAIFLSLKHNFVIALEDEKFIEILALDDCVTNVLLLEYAKRRELSAVSSAVNDRAKSLLTLDARDKDRNWLLIYQVWSIDELRGNGQGFLADLKRSGFQFLSLPKFPEKMMPIEIVSEEMVLVSAKSV